MFAFAKSKHSMFTFWQLLNKFLCTRPDSTFLEFMAWSLFGFPSGPLPVYLPFSIMETAKTASIMASSAYIQNIPSPTGLASVSSKIQEPMAPGSWIQVQLPNDR